LFRILAETAVAATDVPKQWANRRWSWKLPSTQATAILGVRNEGPKYMPYEITITSIQDADGTDYLQVTRTIGANPSPQ
jgi:hypothetical protein